MQTLNIGSDAPDFTIAIATNQWLNLRDLKGKNIVIYFYPKDDTPGCTIEAMDFDAALTELVKLNTFVLGISRDNLEMHHKFKIKYNLQIALGADVDGEISRQYAVLTEKSVFGNKYTSINRTTFLINSKGKIAYIWPNVRVQGHVQEVLNKIRDLDR